MTLKTNECQIYGVVLVLAEQVLEPNKQTIIHTPSVPKYLHFLTSALHVLPFVLFEKM